MGEDSKKDGRLAKFMKKAFIVYSALAISNSPLEGNFINAFRVKNVMAEPVLVKKSPKEAAADFFVLITRIMKVPGEAEANKQQASALLEQWGTDKKFQEEFNDTVLKQVGRVLEGNEKAFEIISLVIEISGEHEALFKSMEKELKEFSKKEIRKEGGKHYDLYLEFRRSPFYVEVEGGKFNLGDLLNYALISDHASRVVDKIAEGDLNTAKEIYDENKDNQIFIKALAWQTFLVVDDIVANGRRDKIEHISYLFGLQEEGETFLQDEFTKIFEKHKTKTEEYEGDYYKLYSGYVEYVTERSIEPSLINFLETICDVHEATKQGKSHLYPISLTSSVFKLSKLKPTKYMPPKEIKYFATIPKYELEQAITLVEKRTEDIRDVIKDLKDDIESYVTDEEAKERLYSKIEAWEAQLKEWEDLVAKAKKIKKQKTFSKSDQKLLEKLVWEVSDYEVKYFMEYELLTLQEVREIKLLSMSFVNALMTGSTQSYNEFQQRYEVLTTLQATAPAKYYFALDFIGAFLENVSPEAYGVVKVPEPIEAITEVYMAEEEGAKELEALKLIYGNAFVDYVVYNKDTFEDILLTPEEDREKLISENYADTYAEAELLYRVPDNILIFIEEVYMAVDEGDEAVLAKLRVDYGNDFVDLISNNMDSFGDILLDPDSTVFTLTEHPEILAGLKKAYLPIAQEGIKAVDLEITLRNAMNFRHSMELALSETDSQMAKKKVAQAFAEYKKDFGNNIGVLKLFYDVDGLFNEKPGTVKDVGEVETLFMGTIIPAAFGFKEQKEYPVSFGHDVLSLYYANRALNEITSLNKFSLQQEAVQGIVLKGLQMLLDRDAYLIPSYYENVIKPMAAVVDDPETFVNGLATFNGILSTRYNPELTQLGYLTSKTRSDFKTIFTLFGEAVDSGYLKELMTHFELQEEVMLGEIPGEKDFADSISLFMPTQPESTKPMHKWFSPGMLLNAPLDIGPEPEIPETAYLPTGEVKIDSDAKGTHQKIDVQLKGQVGKVPGVAMPKDTQIRPLAESRLAMFIRKIFGEIPISYSNDLILTYGDVGLFGKGGTIYDEDTGTVTQQYAVGGAGEVHEKFAEGGLAEYVVLGSQITTKEEEIETAEGETVKVSKVEKATTQVTETVVGGGVGPLGSITQTFTYKGEKGGQHSVKGTLDWLMGLSTPEEVEAFEFDYNGKAVVGFPWDYKWGDLSAEEVEAQNPEAHEKIVKELEILNTAREKEMAKDEKKKAKLQPFFGPFMEGHSILTYVPEAVYETEGGEKKIKGKIYYVSKEGDAVQLQVSEEDENLLMNYLFGSGETEHVLGALRKYDMGTWTADGEWENWGGALGFTVDPAAVFMMEDAIRQVGYDYVINEEGEPEYRADLKKLEAIGVASVPLAIAINNAFENGTVAFITRASVPTKTEETEEGIPKTEFQGKAGVYTLEAIINRVEPMSKGTKHDWELRVTAGYPFTIGSVFKSKEIEGKKEKTWYAKAGTASYFLWSSLLQQENEANAVAEYVTNVLAELYHMEENKAKQTGWMIGGSVMLAGIDETRADIEDMGEMYKDLFSDYKDIAKWDNTFFTIISAYYSAKFRLFGGVQKMPGYMLDAFSMVDESLAEMSQNPGYADRISGDLSQKLDALSKSTYWKGVVGMAWNPGTMEISLLGKADVMEPISYGYTAVGGSLHVGSKKGIQPYGEAIATSYWFTQEATYLDIFGVLGAENIEFAPNDTFTFDLEQDVETAANLKKALNKQVEEVMVGMFTKYYLLSPELAKLRAEEFEFVFAPNMSAESEKGLTHYYLLIDTGEGKGYIGNEKDKEKWVEQGFQVYQDVMVITAEDEVVEFETASLKESSWFSRLKLIAGPSIQLEPKVGKKETVKGWTAGLLADIYSSYKFDLLMGTFAAKREFEEETTAGFTEEEWTQFKLVFSAAWDKLDWEEIGDQVYGYIFFDYTNKEVHIVPPNEAPEKFEIMRATGGTGWTWAFFDGVLGETKKLDIYIEAGGQKLTGKEEVVGVLGEYTPPAPLPGGEMAPGGFAGLDSVVKPDTDFIFRLAVSYSWELSNTGPETWFTIQGVAYHGWWPIGQPVNITQPWTLKSQGDMYDLQRFGTTPWGFMLYLSIQK